MAGRRVSGIFFRIGEREEAGLALKLKSTSRNKGNIGLSKWTNDWWVKY